VRRGQQANDVQINAPGIKPFIYRRRRFDFVSHEIGFEKTVDRIGSFWTWGYLWPARLQIDRLEPAKTDGSVPGQALINPGAEHADLFRREASSLFRHDILGVQ